MPAVLNARTVLSDLPDPAGLNSNATNWALTTLDSGERVAAGRAALMELMANAWALIDLYCARRYDDYTSWAQRHHQTPLTQRGV